MAVSGQVWKRAVDKNNQAEKQGQMRYFSDSSGADRHSLPRHLCLARNLVGFSEQHDSQNLLDGCG